MRETELTEPISLTDFRTTRVVCNLIQGRKSDIFESTRTP